MRVLTPAAQRRAERVQKEHEAWVAKIKAKSTRASHSFGYAKYEKESGVSSTDLYAYIVEVFKATQQTPTYPQLVAQFKSSTYTIAQRMNTLKAKGLLKVDRKHGIVCLQVAPTFLPYQTPKLAVAPAERTNIKARLIYIYVKTYFSNQHTTPSLNEIAQEFDICKSTARHYIKLLIAAGLLYRGARKALCLVNREGI